MRAIESRPCISVDKKVYFTYTQGGIRRILRQCLSKLRRRILPLRRHEHRLLRHMQLGGRDGAQNRPCKFSRRHFDETTWENWVAIQSTLKISGQNSGQNWGQFSAFILSPEFSHFSAYDLFILIGAHSQAKTWAKKYIELPPCLPKGQLG